MPVQLGLAAVAFVSSQNQPVLVRVISPNATSDDQLKYHYLAHTALDVIDERMAALSKGADGYLGFLYAMEDVAVYGYLTPLKLKIILALTLTDAVIRDADVTMIFKALHIAYYRAAANPFLKLDAPLDAADDHAAVLAAGSPRWKVLRARVDEVARVASTLTLSNI
ncbi:Sedlin [Vararia minispora EC-137]|uniref:Sedlin n=1 Tax=Vararia minispora EC-137 TaxID=1314806 RepID=A0ACB8QRU4_9AGAM|nr:Sedlin [Vararia minispora EC-137]